MKYPQLNALVPAGEHFDESAITGEGVWLSTKHIDAIEALLGNNATALQTVNDQLTAAQGKLTESETKVTDLQTQLATANTSNGTKDTKIKELQDEIAELNGTSSGAGSTLKPDDTPAEEANAGKLPKWNDENHPANIAAKNALRFTKKPVEAK